MKRQSQRPSPAQPPIASAKGDLRQLKQNSSATVAELKAFLHELKGKSPQEMLGVVASSQLVRAIGISCVIVLAAIVIFTAIPFAMGGKTKDSSAGEKTAAPTPPPAPAISPSPAAPPATAANPLQQPTLSKVFTI
jgi:hypothetical protein